MEIVMAILLGLIGLAVCFVGLEVFFITLPIWGFVVGFFSGASLIHAWMGGGFFQTTLGIVVGLALGVLFAILAYFFWYFGVVFLCGSVGAMLGNGLSKAIGLDANWWLWIVGLVVGVLFALAALFLAIPVYLVIINTAMAGAAAIIAAVLMLFGRIDLNSFNNGPVAGTIDSFGWLATVIWIVLAVLGMLAQLGRLRKMVDFSLPEEKWVVATANR